MQQAPLRRRIAAAGVRRRAVLQTAVIFRSLLAAERRLVVLDGRLVILVVNEVDLPQIIATLG